MKSAFLYHLYSGDLWFTALGLSVFAIALDALRGDQSKIVRRTSRTLFLLALPLAGLSGVPVPWGLALLGILVWSVLLFVGFGERPAISGWAAAAFIILAAAGIVNEVIWRLPAEAPSSRPETLIVFGDSLSSGGFEESGTWVNRLRDESPMKIVDLSRASATTGSALDLQLQEAPAHCERCSVIIELGGNDMLDGESPRTFEENLRRLISEMRLRGADRIWFIEFPVLPGGWRWAAAQRRLATAEGVTIVPRRILAGVLVDPAFTLDGLHLSDAGHRELARRLEVWLGLEGER